MVINARGLELKVGSKIVFGSPMGEKTKGTILRVNRTRCVIRQDEARNSKQPGTEWNVPFDCIYEPDQPITSVHTQHKATKNDIWLSRYANEIRILCGIYCSLSPENLTCDGELTLTEVKRRSVDLHRKLNAVTILLGEAIDEGEAYQLMDKLKELEKRGAHAER